MPFRFSASSIFAPKPSELKKSLENRYKNVSNKVLEVKNWKLKESNELAELVGIALGDGSIPNEKTHLRICF